MLYLDPRPDAAGQRYVLMWCDRLNRRRLEQLDECRRAQHLKAGVAHAIGGQIILDHDVRFGSQSGS